MFNNYVKHLFLFSLIFLAACTSYYRPVAKNHPIMITAANASEKKVEMLNPAEVQAVVNIENDNFRDKTKTNIRVGVLAPFSGEYKKLGESIKNTALMALYEISSDKVIIQFYDTKGSEEGAKQAINEAINQNIDIVIGPVFSYETLAIKNIAKNAGIDVLAFTSDPNVLGDGVYTLALLLPPQIERIVSYACELGKKDFAVLTQNNEYGKMIVNAAINAAFECKNNAQILNVGYYSSKQGDMVSVIKELAGDRSLFVDNLRKQQKGEGEYSIGYKRPENQEEEIDILTVYKDTTDIPLTFDAILIADEGSNLRSLAAVLNYYDITNEEALFLGTQQWSDPNLAKEKALVGGLYPEIPIAGFSEFANRYKKIYGTYPPRIASQAYDGIALVSVLANNKNFSSEAIIDGSGFAGVDGIFRLLPDGTSERGLNIMEIARPQAKVIEQAPQTFADFPIIPTFTEEEIKKLEEEQKLKDYTINVFTEQPVEAEDPVEAGLIRGFVEQYNH